MRTSDTNGPVPLTAEARDFYTTLLQKRRKMLLGDMQGLENEACRSASDASGDHSSLPGHLAELGTYENDQELALHLLAGEQKEIQEIEGALERLEQGSFGCCEGCRSPIPQERLEALPSARLCRDCKSKEDRGEDLT